MSSETGRPGVGTAGAGSPWILEVRDVKKSYEGGRIEALRGVSLGVAKGDFLAITGASGSGKSTLLHLLGGLDTPTEGSVLFRGEYLGGASDGAACITLDAYRARFAGFIFQSFHLLPSLNAMENVQVPMLGSGAHHANREEKARALVNEPRVLLADEPTGNLDSVNSAKILELLAQVQERYGTTLIMVTHDLDIAATAHRHVAMRDGRICD